MEGYRTSSTPAGSDAVAARSSAAFDDDSWRLPQIARMRMPASYHGNSTLTNDRDCEDDVMSPQVAAVHRSGSHTLSKPTVTSIRLVVGLGVEGDVHAGTTVRHRSRVARDPTAPNLRQVHLIHAELHQELATRGFIVAAGAMGENVTTRDLDLLGLPTGTRLLLGADAIVEVTGLRNPCAQLDRLQPGMMTAVLDHDADGNLVRKAGIMGIVLADGEVRPDDAIGVELPRGRTTRCNRSEPAARTVKVRVAGCTARGSRVSPRQAGSEHPEAERGVCEVIVLGVILLLLGLLLSVPILWTIGLVLVVIGAILWVAGSAGHAVGGRRHYY